MPLLTQLRIDRSGAATIGNQMVRHFEYGVVLARGEFFGFSRGYENCLRLNFSRFDPVQTYADLMCLFGKWAAAPELAV
jgi:hypothetical protein